MRKIIFVLLLLVFGFVLITKVVFAEDSPILNNKFGIHIIQPEDIPDAAKLVNSSGGDWGYVTFVIQKDQRDVSRWQGVFDELRRQHLIPIVRIATRPQDDSWEKPDPGEIDGWVNFLNSLNWVIKTRYIILGNEPNQAKEWGGEINPDEYAKWAIAFSQKLKSSSGDYFIMAAPLDLAAPNSASTMDAVYFWRAIYLKEPDFFTSFDGLASHSYPNPNFSASEYKRGRNSIASYDWELAVLKDFGAPDLSVFITETGWELSNPEDVAAKMKYAYESVWLPDNRVQAVTPFILNYTQAPFENFSWKDKNGNFYPVYSEIQDISKIKGAPKQEDKAYILTFYATPFILIKSKYNGFVIVRNEGQTIWNKKDLALKTTSGEEINIDSVKSDENIEPGGLVLISFESKDPLEKDLNDNLLFYNSDKLISKEYNFDIHTFQLVKVKVESIFGKIWELIKGLQ